MNEYILFLGVIILLWALEGAVKMNKLSKYNKSNFLLELKVSLIFIIGFITVFAGMGFDLPYTLFGIPTIWEGKI